MSKKEDSPLLVLHGSEYLEDEMVIYANLTGLLKLRDMINDVLAGKHPEKLVVRRGKREKHEVEISMSTHEDFPSEFD